MKTSTKRKIICVNPISNVAKLRFVSEMDNLHSCYVDSIENDVMYLTSVNGKYKFTMHKKSDYNWEITK